MKKVLILGDSISIGYREYVKEALKNTAEVVFPAENGRFAKYTLWGLHLWIKELGKPDIVHWNNGLWDVHHEAPMRDALTPLSEYLSHLDRIQNEIRLYTDKIIWATTTPVASGSEGRSNAEIDEYNKKSIELMKGLNVQINDLNAVIKENPSLYISEDKLHLNEAGYKRAAAAVIKKIEEAIA